MNPFSKILEAFKSPSAGTATAVAEPPAKPSLVSLEKTDPRLVDLVKKVTINLEKKRLAIDKAKVALCLDISGSMSGLYNSGQIDAFVQQILALGLRFDDDGDIDIFLFGRGAYHYGSVNAANYRRFTKDMLSRHDLEGDTRYSGVIEQIRRFYRDTARSENLPAYVMFLTDGENADHYEAERQIRDASNEAIFWQFLAIGNDTPTAFKNLRRMNTLPGRTLTNTSFFIANPFAISDDELYDRILSAYPAWLKNVVDSGLLRA